MYYENLNKESRARSVVSDPEKHSTEGVERVAYEMTADLEGEARVQKIYQIMGGRLVEDEPKRSVDEKPRKKKIRIVKKSIKSE